MVVLQTRRQRAALLIIALGAGLALAMAPYASGVVGAPVIAVLFAPFHGWLRRRLSRETAAGAAVAAAVLVLVVPGSAVAGLIVTQAPGITRSILNSPLVARVEDVRIGTYLIGPAIRRMGDQAVGLIASGAFGFLETAMRSVLNLLIALFGAYFLLRDPDHVWSLIRPFIPFSDANVAALRTRFRDVTNSTVIGVLLVAAAQGALLGVMFWVLGLPNAAFWGVVTAILGILPVVGSGMVWLPACAYLASNGRWGSAAVLALWGLAVVGSADSIIRPIVYRRWADIHPFLTLIGAFAGIRWFGILGILVGPLALSYFFALIGMYSEEYIEPAAEARRRTAEMPVPSGLTPPPPRSGNPEPAGR